MLDHVEQPFDQVPRAVQIRAKADWVFAISFRRNVRSLVVAGLRGPDLHHFFCPHCMTWMFTHVEGFDAFVNVRPTLLENPSWFSPFIETMTKERLTWAETPARHRFESFPPINEFGALIQEFSDIQQASGKS
jgi:hypothetical protein